MGNRIIDRSYVGEVLQHMYGSDFDIGLAISASGGYFYSEENGKRVSLQGTTIEEAVTDLAYRVMKRYPASKFATWWSNNFREQEFG